MNLKELLPQGKKKKNPASFSDLMREKAREDRLVVEQQEEEEKLALEMGKEVERMFEEFPPHKLIREVAENPEVEKALRTIIAFWLSCAGARTMWFKATSVKISRDSPHQRFNNFLDQNPQVLRSETDFNREMRAAFASHASPYVITIQEDVGFLDGEGGIKRIGIPCRQIKITVEANGEKGADPKIKLWAESLPVTGLEAQVIWNYRADAMVWDNHEGYEDWSQDGKDLRTLVEARRRRLNPATANLETAATRGEVVCPSLGDLLIHLAALAHSLKLASTRHLTKEDGLEKVFETWIASLK